jgi:hypothetical protein
MLFEYPFSFEDYYNLLVSWVPKSTYTIYILSAMLLSCVLSRVVYANNVAPRVPRGTWGGTLSKGTQAL